jgi:Zn-dependent protease
MSVVIHEVSHGYAALALGDPTAKYQGRLTLNPISHLDPIGSILVPLLGYFAGGFIIGWAKPVPFNPYNLRNQKWGEAMVAIAGPLSNIFLAIIFAMVIRFAAGFSLINQTFLNLSGFIVVLNITLAVFNLIPIPPLDGSKILFALLPYRFHQLRQSLERYGLVFVLIFIFFIWQLVTPFISHIFTLLTGVAI